MVREDIVGKDSTGQEGRTHVPTAMIPEEGLQDCKVRWVRDLDSAASDRGRMCSRMERACRAEGGHFVATGSVGLGKTSIRHEVHPCIKPNNLMAIGPATTGPETIGPTRTWGTIGRTITWEIIGRAMTARTIGRITIQEIIGRTIILEIIGRTIILAIIGREIILVIIGRLEELGRREEASQLGALRRDSIRRLYRRSIVPQGKIHLDHTDFHRLSERIICHLLSSISLRRPIPSLKTLKSRQRTLAPKQHIRRNLPSPRNKSFILDPRKSDCKR